MYLSPEHDLFFEGYEAISPHLEEHRLEYPGYKSKSHHISGKLPIEAIERVNAKLVRKPDTDVVEEDSSPESLPGRFWAVERGSFH